MGTDRTGEFRVETLTRIVERVCTGASPRPAVDRDIAWERVTAFTRSRPEAHIRQDLAALFDYVWEERYDPAGSKQPILTAGRRSRARENALRQRQWSAGVAQLRYLASYAARPPQYYAQLIIRLAGRRPEDQVLTCPWVLDSLADPAKHSALALLGTLADTLMPRVDARSSPPTPVYVPWQEMTKEQRDAARSSLPALTDGEPRIAAAEELVRDFGILFRCVFEQGPVLSSCSFGVGLPPRHLCQGQISRSPSSNLPEPRGCPYRSTQPTASVNRGGLPSKGNLGDTYKALQAKPFPAVGFQQTYPALWELMVDQLAARLDLPIYSDHFPQRLLGVAPAMYEGFSEGPENPEPLPLSRVSLADGLDALCRRFGRIWWADRGALFFRNRDWYWDLLYQTPVPALELLRAELRSRGVLTVDSIDVLAGLTDRQMEGLGTLAEYEARRQLPWNHRQAQMARLMTVWRGLSQSQKVRVLGEGVSAGQLTPAQRRLYAEQLFRMGLPTEIVLAPPLLRLAQTITPGAPPRASDPARPACLYLRLEVTEPSQTWPVAAIHLTFEQPTRP